MSCRDAAAAEMCCATWRIYDGRVTLAAGATSVLGYWDVHARTAGTPTALAVYAGTTVGITGNVLRFTSLAINAPNVLLLLQESVPVTSNFLGDTRQWVLAGAVGQVDQGAHEIHAQAFRLLAINMDPALQAIVDLCVTVRPS